MEAINAALAQAAVKSGAIDASTIRTDTTAVETNIHWPTDASLLWDTWRVATRLLRRGREIAADACPHRFHDKKTKRLYLFITRYAKSKNAARKRKVLTAFRKLIHASGVDRGDCRAILPGGGVLAADRTRRRWPMN